MNIETNGTYVRISATILSPQELAELVAVVSYMLWNNNRNKKMGKFGKGEPRPENEFGTGPVEEYLNHLEKHRNVATHKPVIDSQISINIDSLIKKLNINTGCYSSKENEEISEKIKQALLGAMNSAIAKNDL